MAPIAGAHVIVYSRNAEADRAFLRDVLELPNVDAGDGWLIFALPPAEVAIHPGRKNGVHEFYLTVRNIARFVSAMARRDVRCTEPRHLGWGSLTEVSLPGGGTLGVYEPHHPRPRAAAARRTKRPARPMKRAKRSAPAKKG